ncbi:MAG: CorA family divalent cation transporter [Raoultibacter sp.]
MATRYLIENFLESSTASNEMPPEKPFVMVLTSEEFETEINPKLKKPLTLSSFSRIASCHVDAFEAGFVGDIFVPNKDNLLLKPVALKFFMRADRLIFIDETDLATTILDHLVAAQNHQSPSVGRVLFEFMGYLIKDDAGFLEAFEDDMETLEEDILNQKIGIGNRQILNIRRQLSCLDYYYQQLVDMGIIFDQNENGILGADDCRLFAMFARRADRLFDRTCTIKDYSLQLYELYQTQINVQQNKTIQWLTVITTIFVPLTLITSWYGMNFENMPELHRPEAYFVVIGLSIVLVIVELVYFKKKKWL